MTPYTGELAADVRRHVSHRVGKDGAHAIVDLMNREYHPGMLIHFVCIEYVRVPATYYRPFIIGVGTTKEVNAGKCLTEFMNILNQNGKLSPGCQLFFARHPSDSRWPAAVSNYTKRFGKIQFAHADENPLFVVGTQTQDRMNEELTRPYDHRRELKELTQRKANEVGMSTHPFVKVVFPPRVVLHQEFVPPRRVTNTNTECNVGTPRRDTGTGGPSSTTTTSSAVAMHSPPATPTLTTGAPAPATTASTNAVATHTPNPATPTLTTGAPAPATTASTNAVATHTPTPATPTLTTGAPAPETTPESERIRTMLVEMRAEQESQLGVMIQEFRVMLRVANDDDDDSGQRDVHDDADRQWAISEDEVIQSIEQEEALAEELVQQSQPTGGPDDDAALLALLPDQCSWCGR